jgi:hypothetical protein
MTDAISSPDVTPADTTTAPTAAPTAVAPAALAGWSALRFAVNVNLPRDLANAATVRAATVRVLRGG